MSLDVYLYEVVDTTPPELCLQCIVMPYGAEDDSDDRHRHERLVFEQNTTHNLGPMADAAGIYYALWRPEELWPVPRARDILPLLRQGVATIQADYPSFIALEPENRWGSMATFLPWIKKYIAACNEYPDALVRVSR